MCQINDIVQIKSPLMAYPTMGMVISLSPIRVKLKGGAIFTLVSDKGVTVLRPDLQELFRNDFE